MFSLSIYPWKGYLMKLGICSSYSYWTESLLTVNRDDSLKAALAWGKNWTSLGISSAWLLFSRKLSLVDSSLPDTLRGIDSLIRHSQACFQFVVAAFEQLAFSTGFSYLKFKTGSPHGTTQGLITLPVLILFIYLAIKDYLNWPPRTTLQGRKTLFPYSIH